MIIGQMITRLMTTKKQVKIMLLVKAQIQQVIIKQKQITRSLQVAILEAQEIERHLVGQIILDILVDLVVGLAL